MATTKRRKTSSASPTLASTTAKTIKKRPIATAAVATGIISGIAAAVAGFLAFKKSGKTFPEFRDDVTARVKDGFAEAKTKAGDLTQRVKDGLEEKPQTDIADEALTLKRTGKKTKHPVDPLIEEELKTGAVSY